MKEIDWTTTLPDNENINSLFDSFFSTVSNIIDKHIPLKQLSKLETISLSWHLKVIFQSSTSWDRYVSVNLLLFFSSLSCFSKVLGIKLVDHVFARGKIFYQS